MNVQSKVLLSTHGISKRFGGLQALSDVSITLYTGEIYGLIGPNGAGKTSLFNCLTGLYIPEEGHIDFCGHALSGIAPHAVAQLGIARTFQNIRLFSDMTALENVMVGRHIRSHRGVLGALCRSQAMRAEEASIRARALDLLDYVGLSDHAQYAAKQLSYGHQRRLEIARALATEPQLLALDEPAAGMNATERVALRQLVERIRADGISVLLIEHDVNLVTHLCDRIAVLDYGKKIAEDIPAHILKNELVIKAYLGGTIHD